MGKRLADSRRFPIGVFMSRFNARISELLGELSVEQKAAICCGYDGWSTEGIEQPYVPSITVSDGPNGLRKKKNDEQSEQLGMDSGVKSTCFPTSSALACSWDRELLAMVGGAIGAECQAEDVQVLLGPGCNIKRTPLCGRNFEYYSEDPLLSTEMAGSFIGGVQSKGVGVSLKHFCGNNQETNRFNCDDIMDERTLREIYLSSFEGAVKKYQPKTIMCSYNRLNGVHCSQNSYTLTDILRKEWGFEGIVMSDWGAVDQRVDALKAGLELEMPSSHGVGAAKLVKAVKDGELSMEVLDEAVRRMLEVILELDEQKTGAPFDKDAHHEIARDAMCRSAVLLKNDDNLLPLSKTASIAVIGDMAGTPRYQGAGSSKVTPIKLDGVYDSIKATAPEARVTFSKGYDRDNDVIDNALINEAVENAKAADCAVLVIGLTEMFESEGFDRTHMRIPDNNVALINALTAAQPNTVVLLVNGAPVEMDWIDNVKALIDLYLGGQAVGSAAAKLLFGDVNPSGRLAESVPYYLENNPVDILPDKAVYSEGVMVGYRYYLTRKYPVRFPFGYGLSYTSFEYSDLTVSGGSIKDADTLEVSVTVKNTGDRSGEEVVQLYVENPRTQALRPLRELREFAKVKLDKGESKRVSFTLGKRAFSYYDTQCGDWRAESGQYKVQICSDCNTPVLEASVSVTDTLLQPEKLPVIDRNTTIEQLMTIPAGAVLIQGIMDGMSRMGQLPAGMDHVGMLAMLMQCPLRAVFNMWISLNGEEPMNKIIALLNSAEGRESILQNSQPEKLMPIIQQLLS